MHNDGPNNKASHQPSDKDRTQELIEFTTRLNQEYAKLLETSRVLRKESRVLSEESHVLRETGIRLSWD